MVWLGGFKSDMRSTKVAALAAWAGAGRARLPALRLFAAMGNPGAFEDGTISRWLEEALGVIERFGTGRPILVGSSMGGWIALLAARGWRRPVRPGPTGMVLIAPAVDFTERLMWERFTEEIRKSVEDTGVYHAPVRLFRGAPPHHQRG